MKFIKEQPAEEDLFDGQAHTLVATNIYDSISTDSVFVVGLEGDLGSGKSTILKKVKQLSLDDEKKMHFIEFDTELYHNNNVNKALINILHDEFVKLPSLSEDNKNIKLKSIKDRALGNVVDYTRTVTSSLSWWMVSFVIAALCSVEMISDGVKAIGQSWNALSSGNSKFDPINFLQILFMFMPILWWVFWGICRIKNKGNAEDRPPAFADIFKRQVPERIDEILEIPNEIGSYELKNALGEFVDIIPDENLIVLVIDNLDRVPETSLPQVWADLEVFTQIESIKFKLIIPHSTKHVAKAISESNNQVEGMEFISKRIPIKHRVPPLLQSDWRKVLELYSDSAELELTTDELLIIGNIIQLWIPYEMLQITPRYLKRQINEIVSILTAQPQIPAPIACAYINMTQYGQLKLDDLLVSELDKSSKPTPSHLNARVRTYTQLEKLSTSSDKIKALFVETHFQTNGDIANSELLSSQLDIFLSRSEYDNFTKSDRYGYREVLLNYLPEADVNYLIDMLLTITNAENTPPTGWLDLYLENVAIEINNFDFNIFDDAEKRDKFIFDQLPIFESITNQLIELSLEKHTLRKVLIKIQNYMKQELSRKGDEALHNIDGKLELVYDSLYKTVKLTDKSLDGRLININYLAFIDVFWAIKDKYPLWKS